MSIKTNIKTQLRKILIAFLLVLVSGISQSVSAQEAQIAPATQAVPQSTPNQQEFLEKLYNEFDLSKTEYYQITSQIRQTRGVINIMKKDMSELQNQLNYFDEQIKTTTERLNSVYRQIAKATNEISLINEDIEMKEIALSEQKNALQEYIVQLYIQGNTYLTLDENGEIDAFKLLLADGNTGEVINKIKYLGILEEAGSRLTKKLSVITKALKDDQEKLKEKTTTLDALKKELLSQKENLENQKDSKENLIKITKAQDEIYRSLLEESIKQQQDSFAEIQAFKATIEFIEKKIKDEGAAFDIKKYEGIIGKKYTSIYEFQKQHAAEAIGEFIWPVIPERGISAYFHDPSYQAHFSVQHSAIDIRANQETPVRAAADGVVYKAKDNGYGYSYIMLVHKGGLMTTYGHISKITVEEGQIVNQGEVIGLSGGMPGTLGAGYMTTGPHLHLEFIQNGAYVDPLRFLPLEMLSEENVKTLPESYFGDWQRAVLE